jgi:hypothetical protein
MNTKKTIFIGLSIALISTLLIFGILAILISPKANIQTNPHIPDNYTNTYSTLPSPTNDTQDDSPNNTTYPTQSVQFYTEPPFLPTTLEWKSSKKNITINLENNTILKVSGKSWISQHTQSSSNPELIFNKIIYSTRAISNPTPIPIQLKNNHKLTDAHLTSNGPNSSTEAMIFSVDEQVQILFIKTWTTPESYEYSEEDDIQILQDTYIEYYEVFLSNPTPIQDLNSQISDF